MTKQGFCKLSVPWRKLCLQGSLFILVLIQFQSHCHPSGWGEVGRLFKAGHLLHFSAFRMGTYLRWALIQGWALIQINMVLLILWKTKFFNIIISFLNVSMQEQFIVLRYHITFVHQPKGMNMSSYILHQFALNSEMEVLSPDVTNE